MPSTFWKYGGDPKSDFGDTIRRAVYPTFQLIGEAFAESNTQFALTIQNQPLLTGAMEYNGKQMPGIQAQAIGGNAVEHLTILVSNRTSEQYEPQLLIDGKSLPRAASTTVMSLMKGSRQRMEATPKWKDLVKLRLISKNGMGSQRNSSFRKNSFGILKIKESSLTVSLSESSDLISHVM